MFQKRAVLLLLLLVCSFRFSFQPVVWGITFPEQKQSGKGMSELEQKEYDFIVPFANLSPKERIQVWKEKWEENHWYILKIEDVLVFFGTDTVPYLAEIIRNGKGETQLRALEILCRIDRFVPANQLPVPEMDWLVSFGPDGKKHFGASNEFMIVDGRRIGKEGLEVITWAIDQTKNKDLQFHARYESGLLEQDLEKLSIQEQIAQWRQAIVKCQGIYHVDPDAGLLYSLLTKLLVKETPQSLPLLLDLLEKESNGHVRSTILNIFSLTDTCRMRLRATPLGQKVIKAMEKAYTVGNIGPGYTRKGDRVNWWLRLEKNMYEDDDLTLFWWRIAQGMESLHKVNVTDRNGMPTEEIRQFAIYLTEKDPSYPGWEYTYVAAFGYPDQVAHPKFRQKIARFYEAWKEFKKQQLQPATQDTDPYPVQP